MRLIRPHLRRIVYGSFYSKRHYNALTYRYSRPKPIIYTHFGQRRGIAMLIARIARGALKIRYLLLGGALGGSYQLQKTYEQWKENLPDTSWLKDVFGADKVDNFRGSMIEFRDKFKEGFAKIEIDPSWKSYGEEKYGNLKSWFDQRLDNAITSAEQQALAEENVPQSSEDLALAPIAFTAKALNDDQGKERMQGRVKKLEEELMEVQLKYQKELEKLEKDNKELRKRLLLKSNRGNDMRKVKKSLIDMYSDVLDELNNYDSAYSTADQLPRVVVVGDQSAGKTSVLEMVAQARIFPRGSGEMMTRAPVKVTLSEGPYHIAKFKDGSKEYDLTKESDLKELRREVEIRMINSVREGKTVSNEVISMTVKGPGLQRMVLVDLPGIISTVTTDMHEGTRDAIRHMTRTHMSNPNSIILCIQDGSIDAERSNVTDIVSQVDPQGKRTIFVLTKVDLAEANETNPDRIKKIMSGRLFPMKALGYFAVVTGRGNKNESIQSIKDYEEDFFRSSRLFKSGVVKSHQMTTRNLSLAVSECFWKMVRETVEQQGDAFKATRFNLETEWKNRFPRLREQDRDELFEKARGEILDQVVSLSQLSPSHWENVLSKRLWEEINMYVFENIYLPAAQTINQGTFNTNVDIKLNFWADHQLPRKSVEVGWETLKTEFKAFIEKAKTGKDHDDVFDTLKNAVVDEAMKKHLWENKAEDTLRVIQLNTLEDRSVSDKTQWDEAVAFWEKSLKDKLETCEGMLKELCGPGMTERWMYWKYRTPDQHDRATVRSELEKLFHRDSKHPPSISSEEITQVRRNVSAQGVEVDDDFIRDTWSPVFRRYFLRKSMTRVYDCKKAFYMYHQGLQSEVDCSDVVLFWRFQQMVKATSNSLRQQVMNREVRRLEKEIRAVLEDFSEDNGKKKELLTGRRVELAEELKVVRQIQEKLEEFIVALGKEK